MGRTVSLLALGGELWRYQHEWRLSNESFLVEWVELWAKRHAVWD
jgi:hypothetical protein